MIPSDIGPFRQMVEPLFEYFDKPCTPGVLKIYFAGLLRFELDQIAGVIPHLIEASTFMPRVADFITAIEGAPSIHAERAWDLFVSAVRAGGSMKSLVCRDARLVAAIKRAFGSWPKACESLPTPENPMFTATRKEFLASYSNEALHGEHFLAGIAEMQNRGRTLLPGQTFRQNTICMEAERVRLQEVEYDAHFQLTERSKQLLLGLGQPVAFLKG